MSRDTKKVKVNELIHVPGEYIISSPGVGILTHSPVLGTGIPKGGAVGALTVLNTTYQLQLPETLQGVVLELFIPNGHSKVQYNQPLLRIGPMQEYCFYTNTEESAANTGLLAAGEIGIYAPCDGIFYRRSDPVSPPYVSEGSLVSLGDTLGLIEVMKCFNYIQYLGADMPTQAKVLAILPRNASEIKAGELLFRLSSSLKGVSEI